MKEVSGNYFYNPNIKTNSNDGDGFYSAGTSTKDAAKDFYRKYIELKERLKKLGIENEDEYIDSEEADKIYHGADWDDEWDAEYLNTMRKNILPCTIITKSVRSIC